MNATLLISGLILIGVIATTFVFWHARKRLKLTKDAVRDTEWPGQGG